MTHCISKRLFRLCRYKKILSKARLISMNSTALERNFVYEDVDQIRKWRCKMDKIQLKMSSISIKSLSFIITDVGGKSQIIK